MVWIKTFAAVIALFQFIECTATDLNKNTHVVAHRGTINLNDQTFVFCEITLETDETIEDSPNRVRRELEATYDGQVTHEQDFISADFVISSSTPFQQFEDNDPTNDYVAFQVTDTASDLMTAAEMSSLVSATMKIWNDVESSNLLFVNGGVQETACLSLFGTCTQNTAQHKDGVNAIGFVEFSTTSTLGRTIGFPGIEYDVGLSSTKPWGPWEDSYDVFSTLLHELGHVAGIGHSTYKDAVMSASLSRGDRVRVLSYDDIAAVVSNYPEDQTYLTHFHQSSSSTRHVKVFKMPGSQCQTVRIEWSLDSQVSYASLNMSSVLRDQDNSVLHEVRGLVAPTSQTEFSLSSALRGAHGLLSVALWDSNSDIDVSNLQLQSLCV